MSDQIYVFRFSPIDNPPSRDMIYKVFTEDAKLMNRFLKQHNFIDGMKYVEVTNAKETDVDVCEELEIFHFGSNIHRDKIYDIVTSRQFVDETTQDVGDHLSFVSLFNGLIAQQDIPIIEKVTDILEELPFVYILNTVTADEYETIKHKVKGHYQEKYEGIYYVDNPEEPDDSVIYEALFDNSTACNIQPATMEAYIETFVSLITDEFK